jgi:hypothetical protein
LLPPTPRWDGEIALFATCPGGAQEQTFSFGSKADALGRGLAAAGNYRRIGGA